MVYAPAALDPIDGILQRLQFRLSICCCCCCCCCCSYCSRSTNIAPYCSSLDKISCCFAPSSSTAVQRRMARRHPPYTVPTLSAAHLLTSKLILRCSDSSSVYARSCLLAAARLQGLLQLWVETVNYAAHPQGMCENATPVPSRTMEGRRQIYACHGFNPILLRGQEPGPCQSCLGKHHHRRWHRLAERQGETILSAVQQLPRCHMAHPHLLG